MKLDNNQQLCLATCHLHFVMYFSPVRHKKANEQNMSTQLFVNGQIFAPFRPFC